MSKIIPDVTKGVSFLDRQPVTIAGAFLITVQAVMAAFWAVAGDEGWLNNLTPATQALVTAAIMALATFLTMVWAARKTTSKITPTLPASTRVTLTNGDNKPAAVTTLPTIEEAHAQNAT